MSRWSRRASAQGTGPTPPEPTEAPPEDAAGTSRGRTPVDTVLASPFFDTAWYAETAGCAPRPRVAARHYLRHGRERGLQPHPLFVPEIAAAACGATAHGRDPLLDYVEEQLFDSSTHPLFDLTWYAAHSPESRQHPWGPLGHYLDVGSRRALTPNDWYRPRDDEPRGLVGWVVSQQREWAARQRSRPRSRAGPPPSPSPPAPPLPAESLVGVVVQALGDEAALLRTVGSVLAQDVAPVRVVVAACDDGAARQQALDSAFGVGTVGVADAGRWPTALNLAARASTTPFLAWARAGESWPTSRLRRLQHAAVSDAADAVADTLVLRRAGKTDAYASAVAPPGAPAWPVVIESSRLLVSRAAFDRLGGFDETLAGGWEADLSFRLTSQVPVRWTDVLGATRATEVPATDRATSGSTDLSRVAAWTPSVFNRHALDWVAVSRRRQRADVVTVVVAGGDWRHVRGCVARLRAVGSPAGHTLECLVVDDGSDALAAQVLSSLEHRFPGVRVLRWAAHGAGSIGVNRALAEASGSVVVLVRCDTRVQPGWLEPLLAGLERPEVLGVQSLVTEPSGVVHSAGYAFPATGGPPYDLLQGFPADDAESLAAAPLSALDGSALAVRFSDLAGVRGLDPLFRSGLASADLCLRLAERRTGHFEVSPRSRVVQQRPRRNRSSAVPELDRALFADRWADREPRDDVRLWARLGFEPDGTDRTDGRPALRRPALAVDEPAPRLRWALKVASPAGDRRDLWGDTHFARSVARALRALNQEVVIDHRESFHRPTSHHDDVDLVLRGLEAFTPDPARVSLAWVISHPELVAADELAAFDHVFAASTSWAGETSRRWGVHVEPLLQATDPEVFHPDRGRPDAGEPVLFVGGSRKQHRPLVEHAILAGLPVAVFGSDWEEFIPEHHIKGTFVPNADVGALYASAGVVLNDHWEDMRREGFLSNRLFDAVASGGRVITDDVAGLAGVFGDSVQVATDAATLVRLARHPDPDTVFGSAEQRRAAAALVHRGHSFEHRAHRLLDVAVRAWRGPTVRTGGA